MSDLYVGWYDLKRITLGITKKQMEGNFDIFYKLYADSEEDARNKVKQLEPKARVIRAYKVIMLQKEDF